MVEAYRIGINIRLVDEATPALRALIRTLDLATDTTERFESALRTVANVKFGALSNSLRNLDRGLMKASDSASLMSDRMGGAFEKMVMGLDQVSEKLAAVIGETRALGAASRTIGIPTGAGGGRGRGDGGHGGFRTRMGAGPVHGHFGIGVGDAAGLGLGFGMYKGIRLAASEQLAYQYALLAAGISPDSTAGREYLSQLRSTAEAASLGTIFTRADVAKMMPGIAGMADVPLAQAMPFMKPAIQFGEIERQFGTAIGKTFESGESASAAIRLSHMLGITDPSAMQPVLDMMIAATTTTERSPAQLVNVLQYVLGSASAVGMKPEDAINIGALGSILAPGTRAGTGLNMFLTGLMKQAGPGAGTRIHRNAAHRQSTLARMGFIDPKTHEPYSDPLKLISALQTDYAKESHAEFYGQLVSLFQQRGARMVYELSRNPKIKQMVEELRYREWADRGMGGASGIQMMLNKTLTNEALSAWANLQTIMTDLAEGTVPGLSGALQILNRAMFNLRGYLEHHPNVAAGAGYVGETAAAYAGWRVLRRVGSIFGRGAAAAGGAEIGASGAAAAGGVGAAIAARVLPFLRLGAIGGGLYAGMFEIGKTDIGAGIGGGTNEIYDPFAGLTPAGQYQARMAYAARHWGDMVSKSRQLGPHFLPGINDRLVAPQAGRAPTGGPLGAAAGVSQVTSAVQSSSDKNAATIAAAVNAAAGAIVAAVRQGLNISGITKAIESHLNHEAAKPPASGGGYDGRLSPAFPGAASGP